MRVPIPAHDRVRATQRERPHRRECRVEPDFGRSVDDTHAVGSNETHPRPSANVDQAALKLGSFWPHLSEPRRDDHERAHALGSALLRDAYDCRCGYGDDRHFDIPGNVTDRAKSRSAFDLARRRIDWVELAAETGRDQVVKQLRADASAFPRCSDHRYRPRYEHVADGRDRSDPLAIFE